MTVGVGGGIDFDHAEKKMLLRVLEAHGQTLAQGKWRARCKAAWEGPGGPDTQAWAGEQRRHEDDTVGEVSPANQINQIAEPGSSFGNWVQATRRPA
ncbi:unnamed protein product [Clonostachys rosea]|uniref:Uncharacterized protein n=1 Tax=Bionectria ochroleuca TaxID=29856 RepID=A0ABY6TYP4_BIOOC|nr:unnamed protein product [Clonostachys rosea]